MDKKNLKKAFGITLAKFRTQKAWSQEHLGFEADLTRTYISLLERGKRSPTLSTIFSLATALDVQADELVRQALIELSNSREINSPSIDHD